MTDEQRQAVCSRVAQLLKEERLKCKVSMTLLGKRAGLSQQMISYVERGSRIPSLDTLLRITMALQVDLEEIIRRARQGDAVNKSVSV